MSPDKAQLVRYLRDMGREMTKMADAASLDSLSYLLEAETLMSLRHRLARKNHMTQSKRVSRLPALRGPPRPPGLSVSAADRRWRG